MKKKLIIVSIAAALVLVTAGAILTGMFVREHFWNFIAAELEAEEAARRNAKFPGYGRDTVAILGEGRFQIGKYADDRSFVMYHENDSLANTLLKGVAAHKIRGNKMYVVSSEGCAVADSETDTCRLLITVATEDYIKGYTVDENGVQKHISRFVEDKHIEYLSSMEDFPPEERKILDLLLNKR